MIKRMFHQILFSSIALLPMFALGLGSAASYAAGKHPIDLFRGERHPTEVEFREEMRAADVIICGRVQEICRIEEGGFHPEVVARIDVRRTYKGELPDTNPCIRMEIVGASRLIMARLMMSAAEPWIGVFTATFSATERKRWFSAVRSGM